MSAQVPEPHAPGARSPLARPSPARPFERVGPRDRVHPDHHDVLISGAVRTGEGCRAAALRELREEPGRTEAPGPAEAYRVRADGPRGASFPPVHRRTADRPPRPDPREIARYDSVAPPTVATDGRTPPAPAGAEAVRRLFPL
ncbi:NUDIX domain-containing protein [Streptomyces sp. NPDC056529]|uniref:NUDIX domain-containing protein n=1 Tax=Streptomyces sp. NPDC056529 TaxID=3345855 RepID=UPI0036AFA979